LIQFVLFPPYFNKLVASNTDLFYFKQAPQGGDSDSESESESESKEKQPPSTATTELSADSEERRGKMSWAMRCD
jgi:hypothetical protein